MHNIGMIAYHPTADIVKATHTGISVLVSLKQRVIEAETYSISLEAMERYTERS